ncbi:uncharacterized mitochondrial protein AtMg00810-like [Impatiens glandulifera]|uniref:uncharacterized mitochondrial protein AtMg00810-like n=1 Tax=Impatiens glandulifera TaxID=253017 RepID=UPI001FB1430E|nr:uncharacterized mitochondrial protein AtMg00810-like [Impatiens glandulifera]
MDVKNVFLNDDLHKEVYMMPPLGVPHQLGEICKLHKALYGGDHDGIESLKSELARSFSMKDLGMLRYFLGSEVAYSLKGYLLSQSKYIANLFKRARLTGNRIVDTPLETNVKYSPSNDTPLEDSGLYRTIVGSLVYLTVARLDIAHAVHVVS